MKRNASRQPPPAAEIALAWRRHLNERFHAQAEFARRLAALEGDAASGWDSLIRRAESVMDAAQDSSREGLCSALSEAEAIMAPIGDAARQHTVHCVGHGHIDMNWMWSWPETVAVTNDTFTTVLKLMDEFPGFTYSQSQVSVYEIARKYSPELFERIQARVKEGRWEITASHWVEGDRNLASGESLARHLLYTRRFMAEHFGLAPEDVPIDWCPDTFGHARTIPTIDARGGVTRYYLCRPGAAPRPPVFWWQGPDGSRILVYRDLTWYNGAITPAAALNLLEFREKTGLKDWMRVYGVGDHGGGPTRRDLRRIQDMDSWPIFPSFRFATTRDYYALLERRGEDWPVLDCELNYEFTGCYTSQSAIKRANRYGENAMCEAETAATLARCALNRTYPAEDIREGWRRVLFSHFHDILPGSCVAATRSYNQGMFQEVMATAGMIKTHSLRALAATVDTSFAAAEPSEVAPETEPIAMGAGAGRGSDAGGVSSAAFTVDGPRPVVVFNPTTWARSEVVTISIWDAQTGPNPGDLTDKAFVVRDANGVVVPTQRLATGEYWGHRYVDVAFPVTVGPLGYAAYSLEEGALEDFEPRAWCRMDTEGGEGVNVRGGSFALENEYLTVGFDKSTGGIIQFLDRRTGRNLADPDRPMALLEYVLERPQSGSAWIIGETQTRQCPLEVVSFGGGDRGGWTVRSQHNAPHVARAEAVVKVANSTFAVTFELKAGQPWLDIAIAGQWLERGGPSIGIPQLAIRFPVNLVNATPRYEIPFGSIVRDEPPAREVPALRWASIIGDMPGSGDPAGITLANDSKYGHSLDGSTLRLTLIRSSYQPDPLPEIADHAIRLALAPNDGEPSVEDRIRFGAALNHPLQVVNTDVHDGRLPARLDAGLHCDARNIIVTQIKKAEDEDAVIVRLQEAAGRDTAARVTLARTLFGAVREARELDFLERETPANTAESAADGFTVRVPAHGVSSVRLRFA